MNETETSDVQVLLKKDGKYFRLEVKSHITEEWARQQRLLIFALFKDHHNLREVEIKDIGKL